MNLNNILTITLILFSVIDVVGSLPVIIDMKRQGVNIHPGKSTIVAGMLMLVFLFFGTSVLKLFGLDVSSFALAGSLIIFFIGLEMILGIRFFRGEEEGSHQAGYLVPLVFPILAGAGTLTTIISLRAQYELGSLITGIILNLGLIFLVLKMTPWIMKKMSPQALIGLRKAFGIIMIAIAFQMFRHHWLLA
ncbi:MAG: MarC family protein [Bacteroidia bacterium]|nr:MarC family protein [Bacteroidia bacterium]